MFNFNPRTREGCDLLSIDLETFLWNFNPRTREGCDALSIEAVPSEPKISIHAPVKGATQRRAGNQPGNT